MPSADPIVSIASEASWYASEAVGNAAEGDRRAGDADGESDANDGDDRSSNSNLSSVGKRLCDHFGHPLNHCWTPIHPKSEAGSCELDGMPKARCEHATRLRYLCLRCAPCPTTVVPS